MPPRPSAHTQARIYAHLMHSCSVAHAACRDSTALFASPIRLPPLLAPGYPVSAHAHAAMPGSSAPRAPPSRACAPSSATATRPASDPAPSARTPAADRLIPEHQAHADSDAPPAPRPPPSVARCFLGHAQHTSVALHAASKRADLLISFVAASVAVASAPASSWLRALHVEALSFPLLHSLMRRSSPRRPRSSSYLQVSASSA
jgi:hypothetical protein